MPAKKPMSNEEKNLIVRQEGRRGFLRIKESMIDDIGEQKLQDIFDRIGFQIFGVSNIVDGMLYYGYCPLFAPLDFHQKTLNYVMRINLKEPDPIVEMFIVGGDK